MSSRASSLQEEVSIDEFFKLVATGTIPLFEHLSFEFLSGFGVFAPASRWRTRVHQPPDLFEAFSTAATRMTAVRPVLIS